MIREIDGCQEAHGLPWTPRIRAFMKNKNRLLWIYVLAVATAGLAAYPLLVRDYSPNSLQDYAAAAVLLVATPVAESLVVHFRFRKSAHSFSLLELPLTAGILIIPPLLVVIAYGAGSALVLLFRRRQAPIKLIFNTGTFVLTATIAVFIFTSLPHPQSPFAATTWLAAGVGVMVASLVGTGLVTVVISIADRVPAGSELAKTFLWAALTACGGVSLGLAAGMLATISPVAMLFITTPLVAIFVANRAYEAEHQRRRTLQVVFDTSRTLTEEPESEVALFAALEQCYASMASDFAAIYLKQNQETYLRLLIDSTGKHRSVIPNAIPEPLIDMADRRGKAWLLKPLSGGAEQADLGVIDEIEVLRQVAGRAEIAEALAAPLADGAQTIGIVVVADDGGSLRHLGAEDLEMFETVSRAIASHTRLTRQAYEDPLTGLPNRRRLVQRLDTIFRDTSAHSAALMLIDLDDFKGINDTYGHEVGDQVLQAVAERLRFAVPEGWMAARLGGDEFAVLGPGGTIEACVNAGERVLDALGGPMLAGAQAFDVRGSIGLALAEDAESAATLLRNADTALYEAKGLGKGQLVTFNQPMHERAARRFQIGEALRKAITRDELYVVFQPLIELRTGALRGAEALVRWQHEELGMIPTNEFIEIAEMQNLSSLLASRVVEGLVAGVADIPGALIFSLNVSPGDLSSESLIKELTGAAAAIQPHTLGVEITERILLADERVIQTLGVLREQGIRVYVDDFGTGYSSLSYLKDLPADALKVPREFVRDICTDARTLAIVRGVAALGSALGLQVVAEGIETADQLNLVEQAGAEVGQGYLFARPLSAEDFRAFVAKAQDESLTAAFAADNIERAA